MKKLRVTDASLAKWRWSATDRKANVIITGLFGLEVAISKINEVAFSIRMRVNGVRKRKVFGYFVPGQYGIEQAMDDARKMRAQWRDEAEGKVTIDPSSIPTLDALLDIYEKRRGSGVDPIASHRGLPLPKWWEEHKRMIRKMYEPLLKRSLRTISREDIIDCHVEYLEERERATGKRPTTTVRHTFNSTKPVLVYARDMRWLPPETLIGLRATTVVEQARERFLLPREWQLIAPALDSLSKDVGLLPRFLLATGCRLSMACLMKWGDLDTVNLNGGVSDTPREVTTWFIPRENMKMGRGALLPIVGEAQRIVDLLRARHEGEPGKNEYVFPENVRKAWMNNPDRWQKIVFERSGTKDWHRHDLRRTTATLAKFVGADMLTVKRLLTHAENHHGSATATYVQLGGNVEAMTKLVDALIKVQTLQKDMEEGRVTGELRRLYNELESDDKVKAWLNEMKIDREKFTQVVPDPKHAIAKVHKLRDARA